MRVETLTLTNFRNYQFTQVNLASGVTLIVGPNASGKTTLLEAIAFLSRGKSPKTAQDKTMLRWGEHEGLVRIKQVSDVGVYQTLEARIGSSPHSETVRTKFKQNDKPVRSRAEVVGKTPTVLFFASDLLLLRGGPEDRRQMLDQALTQFDPQYCDLLHRYQQIRTQKNAVLKQYFEQPQPDILQALNAQIIEVGSQIIERRLQYLEAQSQWLETSYAHIADQKASQSERLALNYLGTICADGDKAVLSTKVSLSEIKQAYSNAIHRRQQDEIRRGLVLVGPHRDDILFTLDNQNAAEYASQGQQRSIVLAFKAAELYVLREKLQQESPILLLDDVMAELDTKRQAALLGLFTASQQVLMTTTHLDQTVSMLHNLESMPVHQLHQLEVEQIQNQFDNNYYEPELLGV